MTVTAIEDPRRYFEAVDTRKRQATAPPVCLYLEVTNRCNLLCETCPRTFETLEPPADMTWELFTSIVDQVPDVARVVLHGVGEPMLHLLPADFRVKIDGKLAIVESAEWIPETAAAREIAAQKRRPPRKTTSENVGSAWRGRQPE